MQKKRSIFWLLCILIMLAVMPATVQAASAKFTLINVSKPASLKKGAFFSLQGTVKSTKKMKKVVVSIYDSTGKKSLQKYTAKPKKKTFNLAQADPYLLFNKLGVGKYYFRIQARCGSKTTTVLNQNFSIIGNGKIKIVNPKPSSDVSMASGSTYSIGGQITSTYKLAGVTATIVNSSNKTVYTKTVKPKKKKYTVSSTLDNALLFDRLTAGTYKYKLTAVDNQGTSATLIYRTITVTGSAVAPGSTGNGGTTGGTYLNTNETVETPVGFTPRTTRPAASNKYYYNANYNIYYKYDGLAPTGKAYYGNIYVLGNCTWYACGRAMEIVANAGGNIADVQKIFGPDPVGIYNANVAKGVFEYGSTPRVGALAIFNYGATGDAHIAVVEKVVDGVPYVSESGYTESITKPNSSKSNIIFQYQSIYNWAGGRSLRGYIYLI